ncbi:MAG: Zn-ribbon domain-containing OB-fold protein [Candidatus Aenigmatarchaeota archaeon]
MPHKSSIPLVWRLKGVRYRLVGSYCEKCKKFYFPPRNECECKERTKTVYLSGFGTVVSYTTITAAPSGFEAATPYKVGIVELEEGPRITTGLIGDIHIGTKVKAVFREIYEDGKDGLIHYGYKFVPVE